MTILVKYWLDPTEGLENSVLMFLTFEHGQGSSIKGFVSNHLTGFYISLLHDERQLKGSHQ